MQLTVELGERAYPIYIGSGYLTDRHLFERLLNNKKLCIVSNKNIADIYLSRLQAALPYPAECIVLLPDGEQYKDMQHLQSIFDQALAAGLNRSSIMIALGGGVVGDMTGFAAACYQRGIDFVQIPTSLLAQVDSSVGGKTGINHPLGKNMIGAFHQPRAVIIDTDTLRTLPERELAAGLAEVIKYGLIADKAFFDWLENNIDRLNLQDTEALQYAIHQSCQIKAQIVAQDEKEGGIRAILNLGHTFGHAIEAARGYGDWLHGEAVAAGMVMAVDLSCRLGWIETDVLQRTRALLQQARLPVMAPASMSIEDFLRIMAIDKKNIHGAIRLVLLKSLGEAVVTEDFDRQLMEQVINDNIGH